jgi:hypothetical protein
MCKTSPNHPGADKWRSSFFENDPIIFTLVHLTLTEPCRCGSHLSDERKELKCTWRWNDSNPWPRRDDLTNSSHTRLCRSYFALPFISTNQLRYICRTPPGPPYDCVDSTSLMHGYIVSLLFFNIRLCPTLLKSAMLFVSSECTLRWVSKVTLWFIAVFRQYWYLAATLWIR